MSVLFKDRQQGANLRKVSGIQRLLMVFVDHFRQAFASLGELYRTPFASFMTIAVLGVSLTLPGALYIIVKNTENITQDWQQAAEITLFLKKEVNDTAAQQLVTRLSSWSEVNSVSYSSPEQNLNEFQTLSGLGNAIGYLEENPLPGVVMVAPTSRYVTPRAAEELLNKLRQEREVESGTLDIEWLERLHAAIDVAKEVVLLLALLLLFAVVLIIGNTIRLNILNKREEIVVMKLVGATDSFIHRPFLYTGFWFGLIGGVLAWISISIVLLFIDFSVSGLFEKYRIDLDITGLQFSDVLTMVLVSVALGLLGSFISVSRHVRDIEPE